MTKFDDLIMKENIKIYEEVIQKICELFIKLNIHKDPVKIYEAFIQMFENGILSNHGIYKNMIPNKYINIEVNGLIAMDICGIILFTGFGVCRHTTDFLRHIYQHLGYDSSQLFTYHPSLQIHAHNFGKKILTNEEFQKYIDEAIVDLDLFSNIEQHFTKKYGDILIMVDYLPETYSLINHTMNIVLDQTKRAHILDTRYHCIGEKIDNRSIKFNYKGLTHTDFIQREFVFHTYYETNYFEGLNLLEFETHMGIDMITSALYSTSCNEHIEYFKQFQLENQKSYNKVVDNLNILEKRIRW